MRLSTNVIACGLGMSLTSTFGYSKPIAYMVTMQIAAKLCIDHFVVKSGVKTLNESNTHPFTASYTPIDIAFSPIASATPRKSVKQISTLNLLTAKFKAYLTPLLSRVTFCGLCALQNMSVLDTAVLLALSECSIESAKLGFFHFDSPAFIAFGGMGLSYLGSRVLKIGDPIEMMKYTLLFTAALTYGCEHAAHRRDVVVSDAEKKAHYWDSIPQTALPLLLFSYAMYNGCVWNPQEMVNLAGIGFTAYHISASITRGFC
jgi:hypothetical protein